MLIYACCIIRVKRKQIISYVNLCVLYHQGEEEAVNAILGFPPINQARLDNNQFEDVEDERGGLDPVLHRNPNPPNPVPPRGKHFIFAITGKHFWELLCLVVRN